MMPGKSVSPACSFRTRLSRISCLTGRDCTPGSPQIAEGLNWGSHEPILSQRSWERDGGGADYTTSPLSHPFFTARRPLVFAHRGGSALAPENTIAAFDRGLALGADGLELDVHLSRDGVVVVHHDRTLERTTNLAGPVASRTADELARADAGYFFRRVQPASARFREPRRSAEAGGEGGSDPAGPGGLSVSRPRR